MIVSEYSLATGNTCVIPAATSALWCTTDSGLLQVGSDTDWDKITVGAFGVARCAIKKAGTLYCWGGTNAAGQIGDGSKEPRPDPVQVGTDTDWVDVAPNALFTCGIKGAGELWCWGNGFDTTPTQVGTDTDWAHVIPMTNASIARKSTGSLWRINKSTPIAVQIGTDMGWTAALTGHSGGACGVKTGGELWCLGVSVDPVRIGTDTDWAQGVVKAVLSSSMITLAGVKTNGTLWQYAALTVSSQVGAATDWKDVQSGNAHNCARNTSDALYCWGMNSGGVLGAGATAATEPDPIPFVLP